MTLPVLRSWQPGSLVPASQQVATTSGTVDDNLQVMTRSMDLAQEWWEGATADAALARTERVGTAGNRTATALLTLADVLASAAAELSTAQRDALALVEAARAEGYLVSDDGWVQAPPVAALPMSADATDARQRVLNAGAEQHAARIGRALDAAAEADGHWSAAITRAVDDIVAMATQAVTAAGGELSAPVRSIVEGTSQLPSDPQALHDLWVGLAALDKEALIAQDPGIGNRDGIPVVDRDHLNQRFLGQLRAAEQNTHDDLVALHPEWTAGFPFDRYAHAERDDAHARYQQWQREVDGSAQLLQGYGGVGAALGDGPTGNPPRYLMGIDGADRAIIATGNPDTAANVATMVPGTGSTLAGISGDVGRADAVRLAARNEGSPSTAAVTWFGYAAPPAIPDATDERHAAAAAPALGGFQDGLRVTHVGEPSHNVVLGHSYGTTVVGTAATGEHSLDADDVVFVASPGTMTDDVTDLRLDGVDPAENGQHVYATKAQYDPVPLYAMTGDFGRDPTSPGYGARTFESAGGGVGPWYALGWNPDAHSGYWDEGNPALAGMGAVVAGNGGSVR